jgi:signal transduction histidine kinase
VPTATRLIPTVRAATAPSTTAGYRTVAALRNAPRATPAGAGLGLSIVRSVAAAHQGDVIARARPAGGLDISVRLPGNGADMTKISPV